MTAQPSTFDSGTTDRVASSYHALPAQAGRPSGRRRAAREESPRVATTALRAKHTRVDGTPVLLFETPTKMVWQQAAAGLATKFWREPARKAIHKLADGLHAVAREGVPTVAETVSVSPVAMKAYRDVFREQNVFPDSKLRKTMLAELREAHEQARASGSTKPRNAILAKQPRLWSKHEYDVPGMEDSPFWGDPAIQLDVQHFLSLSEASVGLAMALADEPARSGPRGFGERTARNTLQVACRKGWLYEPEVEAFTRLDMVELIREVTEEAEQRFADQDDVDAYRDRILAERYPANPVLVDHYRHALLDLGVYTA